MLRPFYPSILRRSLCGKGSFESIRLKHSNSIDVKEISIPVPWGHVAGRHWNGSDPSKEPILCIHGWKDNAATWDHLFPLLIPKLSKYQFLAIDLPGHGQSSHFPPGMIYSIPDVWVLIERIRRHFEWTKINLIGHSMGAQISFLYCGTHPDVVKQFVAIDALSPVVLSRGETIEMIPKLTNDTLTFEKKLETRSQPIYTYEEIVMKLLEKHTGGLDERSCKTLMTRGITEVSPESGKCRFTHDLRVQHMPITGISGRQVKFIAKNFRSDILHIKAIDGINYTKPYIKSEIEGWLSEGKNNVVRFVELEGTHHVQLVKPQNILDIMVSFLGRNRQEIENSSMDGDF